MPHWLIHGSAVVGRVSAGLLGCICFYLAFFLYEDEKGRWQNRVEDLWSSVYDRAKVTDTTTTAFFNRLAAELQRGFDRVFGIRLWSIKAAAISANLSLGFGFITGYAVDQLLDRTKFSRGIAAGTTNFFINEFYGTVQEISTAYKRTLSALVTGYPGHFLFTCLLFIACALCIAFSKVKLLRRLAYLPVAFFIGKSFLEPNHFRPDLDIVHRFALLVLVLSVVWDFIVIVIMRRLFAASSHALSIRRVLYLLAIFTSVSLGSALLPELFSVLSDYFFRSRSFELAVDELADLLTFLNVTTVFYSLVPVAALALVLAHRLIWPILSRLLYPIASEKVLGNRKVLVSVGSVCATFALNLGPVGIKELLGLLGK